MSLKVDVLDKIAALITAAFGLVAALAWNSAIQKIFDEYFPPSEGILGAVLYAVIVTVIAVIMTIWIARVFAKAKKKDEAEVKKA